MISTALFGVFACSESSDSESPGTLRVIIEPEDTILDGLSPGEGIEDIRDGWTVTYDKYLIAIGHVAVDYATDRDLSAEDDRAFIVDLTEIPSNGTALWEIEGLRPGRWNFGFELTGGAHDARRHKSVDEADYDRMVDDDLTYLITGRLTKEDGQSCPPPSLTEDTDAEANGENAAGVPCYDNPTIEFEFAVTAETVLGNCELDGIDGIAITEGATTTEAVTIHGDHPFFNGFPTGDEGGVLRLAQIWADADLNLDGKIDVPEFEDVLIADMTEWDDRYQTGGAPGKDGIETLGDVIIAQLKTQGHLNGEGGCEVDGEPHDHDHE